MPRTLTVLALSLVVLGSCARTPAPDPDAQELVEAIAGRNDKVVRLTVHAMLPGKTSYMAVASTSSKKRGQPSDPEDLRAIRTGQVIVMNEPGGIDVTVPIAMKNGAYTAVAGVTMSDSMDREAAIAAAKNIAAEVERGLKK